MGVLFFRTIVLYVVVIAVMRLMGKRQIGELQPSEFVVAILISELAAIPMQETGIPLLSGIIPILTLISCEILLSGLTVVSVRARRIITGHPVVLIANGQVLQHEMRRLRFTSDDLMEELRLNGYRSVDEVGWAVIETNGKLSVFPNAENTPATAGMLNIQQPPDGGLPLLVISDGVVIDNALTSLGRNRGWLHDYLTPLRLTPDDVFLMMMDSSAKITLVPKEPAKKGA